MRSSRPASARLCYTGGVMRTLIRNAHVVSPGIDLKKASVVLEAGVVQSVTTKAVAKAGFNTVGELIGKHRQKAAIGAAKKHFGARRITIEAQSYVKTLYTALGFTQTGPEFLEDGIPHVPMQLQL